VSALGRALAPAVLGIAAAAFAALCIAATAFAAASGESPAPARVEARSTDLLAIGVARDDKMTIRLSRLLDNAPVRDAAVTVTLRGVTHPTTAEADGSFTLQTKDLAIPGAAAVEFQVAQTASRETLKGTLQVAGAGGASEDKNTARQLWWWVLNFAVCIGFLLLISRRRKAAQD
jgi:hypothetical protein